MVLKKLGKYELIEEVGRGAMGEVYKARDPLIGRPVALKTITRSLVGDAELLERFYREARSAGALEHPNIVTIYELGKEGDIPFIAMEFLEGESLEKIIDRRAPLSLLEKIGYLVPVCRALDYAHRRGVVHRDIKPGNIMLTTDGKIKVVDFGIARLVNAAHTQTNMFMGTLSYMSPQQIYGERADERSDIWALGVTLYELLSFRRPFDGDNHATLMLNIAEEKTKPPSLYELLPDCSPALEALVGKMLEKDVRRRFQTMEEVLLDMEPLWEALQQESVSGLVAESETLVRAREYTRARDLLRKALQYDSRHGRAKTLLEQVTGELRLIQIRVQVTSILERAQKFMEEGRYQEAQSEAESALKLDLSSNQARHLVAEARRLAERKRLIQDGLQITRQRMAEGALTQAAQEIRKVLDLDPDHPQGRTLQKQIEDHILQREEQKRVAELLRRARKFWADQRFDDCIAVLTDAKKEFPADPEISKLLETARLDRLEHEKQKGLTEARNLLTAQRVDEALARIQALAKQHPSEPAVQKLHELVLHERQELQQRRRLEGESAALHSLVDAAKFSEAVARGEKLLKEFPQDSELAGLLSFARAEMAQLEEKRKIDEALQGIAKKLEAEQFKSAVAAAEKALTRFPAELALTASLEQARAKLKEKEDHEFLQHRIGEIRARINKGQHTDAVDLARQTLATRGPDPQTTQLLRAAEMELAEKREKVKAQEKHLAEVQTVVLEGRYADATQILKGAFETQTLSKRDPRVQQLLKKIKEAKTAAAAAEAASTVPPAPEAVEESATASTSDSSEYVLPQGAPVYKASPASVESPVAEMVNQELSATLVSGPVPQLDPQTTVIFRTREAVQWEQEHLGPQEETQEAPPADPAVVPASGRVLQFLRDYPFPLGAAAVVLVVAIVLVSIYVSNASARADVALRNKAQQLEQQKNWPAALAAFESLAGTNRAMANAGRENADRLKKLLDQENSFFAKAQDSESAGKLPEAKKLYEDAANLHGDREPQAVAAIAALNSKLVALESTRNGNKRGLHVISSSSARSTSTAKETPKPAGQPCQLIASDVLRHLERADRVRGQGQYVDAERLYKDVIACEPNNDRAKFGLDKAIKGQQTDGQLSPSN
jgi:eukaryotic-like serine/threonine-protein kinase